MPLTGSAKCRSDSVVDKIADELGCEPAVIDAIITVEANGKAYDPAGRLVIRPEAHKVEVCPYLTSAEKVKAKRLGFTKQPKTASYTKDPLLAGDQCWGWVDNFRMSFGDDAAFWITSFGAPQIMGFNHHLCGYELPSQMATAFAECEDDQLIAMGRFLKSAGLVPALRTRNWKQIARKYNGKNYAQNNYDVKLRNAYERSQYKKMPALLTADDDVLQYGDSGVRVKQLQERLRSLGFYLDPDGDFGEETKDAVMAFQRRNALITDGKVGAKTQKALDTAPPKEPNQKPVAAILAESKTAQAGAGTAGLGFLGLFTSMGNVSTAEVGYVPPPTPSLQTVNDALVQAEKGIGAANKLFSLGTEKILLALAICAIVFGAITIYQRITAQRQRKVG